MGRRQDRIQVILLGVILITIPLYLIGIALLLFTPDRSAAGPSNPTNTPQGSNGGGSSTVIATFTPLNSGNQTPMVTRNPFETVTQIPFPGISPTVTRIGLTFVPFTPIYPTQQPTQYIPPSITPRPTNTTAPTNAPQPTDPPAATDPPPVSSPLLPPTNTPSS